MEVSNSPIVTLVQLKEYLAHCEKELSFFKEQEALKSLPDQHKTHVKNRKYYEKEVSRMNKKIALYPL